MVSKIEGLGEPSGVKQIAVLFHGCEGCKKKVIDIKSKRRKNKGK